MRSDGMGKNLGPFFLEKISTLLQPVDHAMIYRVLYGAVQEVVLGWSYPLLSLSRSLQVVNTWNKIFSILVASTPDQIRG